MSRPVLLSADSTCDLGAALLEKYKVHTIPFNVTLGDEQYLDGVTIDPDAIYAIYHEKKVLPRTAAINIATYEDTFRAYVEQGFDVVHVSLGHGLSSSNQNAGLAAEEVGNVWVIDSCNLSTGSGLLVLEAAKRIAAGLPAEQVAEEVRALVSRCHASFVLDTLEFLHKGGRCSSVAMLGANVLKLKPCIEVINGAMSVGKKYRGKYSEVLLTYAKERLAEIDDIDTARIFVTHTCEDQATAQAVYDLVKATGKFDEVLFTTAGCTISAHCGPNTLGVLYIRKTPKA